MVNSLADRFSLLQNGIRGVRTFDKIGVVRRVIGLVIESEGPEVSIGQVCSISSERTNQKIEAQVIGFRENTVLLMALNSVHLIHPGPHRRLSPSGHHAGVSGLGWAHGARSGRHDARAVSTPRHHEYLAAP